MMTVAEEVQGCPTAEDLQPTKPSDAVYKPHHYCKWKIEPIKFILENELGYGVGNVIKYVMRYKDKNGLEDLRKAKRYIDLIIETEYPGADI